MSGRQSLTQIPPDVEYFPLEHLVNLLRVIANERDELYVALQNEQAKSATAQAAAAAAVVYPTHLPNPHHQHQQHQHQQQQHQHHPTTTEAFGFPFTDTNDTTPHDINAYAAAGNNTLDLSNAVPTTFKVDGVKKRIAKKSYLLVKKTAHNRAKKPYTELEEAVPNAVCAFALFEGFETRSDTNRMTRWDLVGDEVVEWLHGTAHSNKHKFIHPVKFDGKVIAFGGTKPFVYAWAAYDSLVAKFDRKGASLSLKFRTKMVGSGRPEDGSDSPPCLS